MSNTVLVPGIAPAGVHHRRRVGESELGTAAVIITGIEAYKDTVSKPFVISPAGTTVTKLKKAKKSFTVKWRNQPLQITGYEIQYSLKKNFKGAKKLIVRQPAKTSAKVKKLKAKKRYYVKIRNFRTVAGKTYYSTWSTVKKVKTK